MKFMTTWSLREGQTATAAKRFLAGEATSPPGMTLLGRWHAADLSCGWALSESDSAESLYANALKWADELAMEVVPVIEDQAAGQELAKRYGDS